MSEGGVDPEEANDRRRIVTIGSTLAGTIAVLVIMALVFERTYVPAAHYEIGWAVKLLGCSLMAWKVRMRLLATLILSLGFLAVVHYGAFYIGYAVLESAVIWKF